MPRPLILPAAALGVALAGVATAFLLDTGGPAAREAALLIGTGALWAAVAATVWLVVAAALHRHRR